MAKGKGGGVKRLFTTSGGLMQVGAIAAATLWVGAKINSEQDPKAITYKIGQFLGLKPK